MNQPVKRLDGSLLNGNHIKVEPSEDKTWPDLVASKQDSRLEVRRRLLNYRNTPHPFNRRDSS